MFRFQRRRYVGARHIARRLGVSVEVFLSLYGKPVWRVPRPRVIRDRARWDMVEVEYWLDTLALVQPPTFDDWLAINSPRVAPYTVGWSLLELLRPAKANASPKSEVANFSETPSRPVAVP